MDDLFAIRCLSDRLEQPAPPPIVMPKSLSSPAPGAPSKLHAGASPTKGVPQPWKKGMGGASTAAEGVPFTHLRGCPRTGVAGSRDGRRRRVATYHHGGYVLYTKPIVPIKTRPVLPPTSSVGRPPVQRFAGKPNRRLVFLSYTTPTQSTPPTRKPTQTSLARTLPQPRNVRHRECTLRC